MEIPASVDAGRDYQKLIPKNHRKPQWILTICRARARGMRALGRRKPPHQAFNGQMLCGDSGSRQGCAHPPHYLSGSLRSPPAYGLPHSLHDGRAPASPPQRGRRRPAPGFGGLTAPSAAHPPLPLWSCRRCRSSIAAPSVLTSARCRLRISLPLVLVLQGTAVWCRGGAFWLSTQFVASRRCPWRAPAPGSPRCATSPLRGTAVVASLRFFSATALIGGSRLRGFPVRATRARVFPPPALSDCPPLEDILRGRMPPAPPSYRSLRSRPSGAKMPPRPPTAR